MDPQIALMLPVSPSESETYTTSPEIEVIRTGTFTDMNGRTVEITAEDLDAFVRGFEEYAAGQAIPIDIDHRREEAAGWVLGVRRDGSYLLAIPDWNELGMVLVGDRRYRYISATINLAKKFLVSVSLTNFPAVKYLAPISLSEFAAGNAPAPTGEETVTFLYHAKESEMPKTNNDNKTPVGLSQGNPAAAPDGDKETTPVQDKQDGGDKPTELAADKAKDVTAAGQQLTDEGVKAMRAQIRAELAEEMKVTLGDFRAELLKSAQLSEQDRLVVVREVVQNVREEQRLAAFAQEVTSTGVRALPFKPAELQEKIAGLPAQHRATVMEMLRTIYDNGTVDFSEKGTSAADNSGAKRTLSPSMQSILDAYLSEEGATVADFFEFNKDVLGGMEQYELSAYQGK